MYLGHKTVAIVRVPDAAVGQGLKIQIGCHSDYLGKSDRLIRPPRVTSSYDLDSSSVRIASLWGGLIYVIVPKLFDSLQSLELLISNVTKAPYYAHGKTDESEWQHLLSNSPSPDVELEGENVILTVGKDRVQDLVNPANLMDLWDSIMRAIAKLSACGPVLTRKERIVADLQISVGSMHAGYPIMMYQDSAQAITDHERMLEKGSWGITHELGHNQQWDGHFKPWAWEIRPHTSEATCNLWAVYVHEEVFNIPRDKGHYCLSKGERSSRVENFVKNGAQLEEWRVWTCLETYLQLQEGFGWEPFQKIFKLYQSVEGHKMSNPDRMNLFAKKFSEEVQKNLAPFFTSWGWPIEEKTAEELAALPDWEDNPMANFL